jgi:DNA-binding transcriptional LysR family regulator
MINHAADLEKLIVFNPALSYTYSMKEILSLVNLKYFCDAVRLGGLSAAAKANFVTQSAISQGILKLEKSLGISLLAHHPNRLRLTSQGEAIFNDSMELLKKITDFQNNLTQDGLSLGELEFACTHSFALAVIPPYLKRFREEYPEVKVNFHLGNDQNIIQMVKEGTVDFGILPLEICQDGQCQPYGEDLVRFHKRLIYQGSFGLYTSFNQKNGDFILPPSDSKETLLLNEAYAKKYGVALSSVIEVGSWEIIAELVAEGLGIGYLPDYIAKQKPLLRPYDLQLEAQQYRISAISPKGMTLRPSTNLFLSYFI